MDAVAAAPDCNWTPIRSNPAPAYPQTDTDEGGGYAEASASASGFAAASADNESEPNENGDWASAYSGNSESVLWTASPSGCKDFVEQRYTCDLACSAWGRAWSDSGDHAVATGAAMLSDDASNTVGPDEAHVDVWGNAGSYPQVDSDATLPGGPYSTPWLKPGCVTSVAFQCWAEAEADVQGHGQSNAEAGGFYYWETLVDEFVPVSDCD